MAIRFHHKWTQTGHHPNHGALSPVFASGLFWCADCSSSRMLRGQEIRSTTNRAPEIPATGFLDKLASELKIGRHAAYRHAVQRALETVRKNYESGQYRSTTEAEHMLRKLVEQEQNVL